MIDTVINDRLRKALLTFYRAHIYYGHNGVTKTLAKQIYYDYEPHLGVVKPRLAVLFNKLEGYIRDTNVEKPTFDVCVKAMRELRGMQDETEQRP